jgi:glycosyltransferase involved in cell wall biosynthesis
MKVLHVIPSIDLRYGGPSSVILEMLRSLQNCGVDVTLLSAISKADEENLKDLRITFPICAFKACFRANWGIASGFSNWLKQEISKYELVHIHTIFSYTSYIAARYCRAFGIPYIVTPHGALDAYCLKQKWVRKQIYLTCFGFEAFKRASAIHCASSMEKAEVARLISHRNIQVVPFGTDEPKTYEASNEHFFKTNNRQIILFLGRIHPIKGIEFLIEAAGRLRAQRNDFIIAICGNADCHYGKKLQSMVKQRKLDDCFCFLGFLKGPEKTQFLLRSSCLVLPSHHENFGVSVIEAMACGLPVIISDKTGLADSVVSSGGGMVVRNQISEIESAIKNYLDHPEFRSQVGEKGKKLVEKEYRWRKVVGQMVDLYNKALK